MKAAQISQYGDASVIEVASIEKPTPQEGQVLVEIHAASLNPFDTTVRSGKAQLPGSLQPPFTLGGDFAGVIIEVGSEVEGLEIGDKVYGQASAVSGGSGALAEFATAKASQVAKVPEVLKFSEAASLPLVGVSALQALTKHINLQSEQKIFIHGGAGGIGRVAIQIAKHLGAYVATTATGDTMKIVEELGADVVIDYKAQNFVDELSDFDAVFDTVGGDDFAKSFSILKRGGIAVSMVAHFDQDQAQVFGITALTQFTKVTTKKLEALRKLVDSGVINPQVGQVYPLSQVREAFIARESGQVSGKVVVEINP